MKVTYNLRRIVGDSSGLTVVEVAVVTAVLGIVGGLMGGAIFQVVTVQGAWRKDLNAEREIRHAFSWFAGDALNAQSTSLVDGDPPSASVTLTWTDSEGVAHTSVYALSGSQLVRDFDGVQTPVARSVTSAAFSLSGKMLTLQLVVEAGHGETESGELMTYLRKLQ